MEIVGRLCGNIGRYTLDFLVQMSRVADLAGRTFYWIFVGPIRGKSIRWKSTIEQMVLIGYESIPIVGLILFFVGLIMAMQAAYQLEPFGATIYVADLTVVSITREFSPLLTSIVITARSGSAITAEIGTMKVSEEIDALQTMGFNPIRFLVVPKMIAMIVMVPILTLMANFLGILGGYLISMATLDVTSVRYINQTINAMHFQDLFSGLVKSYFFSIIIALIGCYEGFNVKGGAEGVGKSTTRSVVASIFLIIAADVFFTALFFSSF